ncbi:hypothetical protein J8N01_25955 [Priestia megaterium]|uniref:hypothetical protein n=1 Tax=Priestia megaterium TaxID=1404 RepID=UPI002378277E|nr:hypothetical protein [Priestia megaterium]WDM33685.1 hypothetical protein J8N01_25955 [Priestia megaterium]
MMLLLRIAIVLLILYLIRSRVVLFIRSAMKFLYRYESFLSYTETLFKEDKQKYKKFKIKSLKLISKISILVKEIVYLVGRLNFQVTIISPFLFLLLFILLYNIVPNSLFIVHKMKQFNELLINMGINISTSIKSHPSYTIGLIDVASNVLAIFWSISLTIYFFAYRERKSVSISSNLASGNIGFIIGLALILFNTIYGKAFAIPFNKEEAGTFYDSSRNIVRLIVWGGITATSIWYGINTLRKMLNSIDIRTLIEHSMSNINTVIIQTMIINKGFKFRRGLYEYLNASIETYYQTLIVCVEKNMMEVYNESFKSLEKLALLFSKGVTNEMLEYLQHDLHIKVPANLLYDASNENYIRLHKSLLIQHMALVKVLHDNNRQSEISKCINIFFEFEPSDNFEGPEFEGLKNDFHTILHQLIMYLDSEEPVLFRTGLDGLEKFCERELTKQKPNIGGIRVYKHLILNAVEQGDTKLIGHLVYSMKRLVDSKNRGTSTQTSVAWGRIVNLVHMDSSNSINIEKVVIYLILQSVLKSVELSKYAVTGFLVKYLITNHCKGSILKETFNLLIINNGKDIFLSKYVLRRKGYNYSDIDVNFAFNEDTIEYCIQKMAIIIYTQQVFAKNNSLPGTSNMGQKIDISIVSSSNPTMTPEYLKYLEEKITKAKDKFGLVSLKMMKQYFGIPEEDEEVEGESASQTSN